MVRMVFSKVPQAVLLKNVGKGTAFGVAVTDVSGQRLSLRSVEAVEPLGEGPHESRRIGRISHALSSQPVPGQTYDLHYQDITGRWHRTTAILKKGRFVNTFTFLRWSWRVPKHAREEAVLRG
jgi:hypothetical protein